MLANDLRAERSKLRGIPVARVADKLGFGPDDNGFLAAKIFDNHTRSEFDYRLLLDGERFRVEVYHRTGLASYDWVSHGSGKGAIDLMKVFMPKKPVSDVCGRLAELFPESKEGIVVELLESSSPELWRGLGQRKPAQLPSVDPGPDPKRDSKSSHDAP